MVYSDELNTIIEQKNKKTLDFLDDMSKLRTGQSTGGASSPEIVKLTKSESASDGTTTTEDIFFFIGKDGVKRVNKGVINSSDITSCKTLLSNSNEYNTDTKKYYAYKNTFEKTLVELKEGNDLTLTDELCKGTASEDDKNKKEFIGVIDEEVFYVEKSTDGEVSYIRHVPKDMYTEGTDDNTKFKNSKCNNVVYDNNPKPPDYDYSPYTSASKMVDSEYCGSSDIPTGKFEKRAIESVYFIDKNKIEIKKVNDPLKMSSLNSSCNDIPGYSGQRTKITDRNNIPSDSPYAPYAALLKSPDTIPLLTETTKCYDKGETPDETLTGIEAMKLKIRNMLGGINKSGGDEDGDDGSGSGLGVFYTMSKNILDTGKTIRNYENDILTANKRNEYFDVFKRYLNVRILFFVVALLILGGIVFSMYRNSGSGDRKGWSIGELFGFGAGAGAGVGAMMASNDEGEGDGGDDGDGGDGGDGDGDGGDDGGDDGEKPSENES